MIDVSTMTPKRPYLFRAFYDWILDNELTPYIVVNAEIKGVEVPSEFVEDGQIVLNLAPHSIGQYMMNNIQLEFNARFGGVPRHIVVPIAAIDAIYARENGIGIGFEPEPQYESIKNAPEEKPKAPNPFRVVK